MVIILAKPSSFITKSSETERDRYLQTNEPGNLLQKILKRYDKIYAMADDVLNEMRRIARNKFDASKN